MRFHGAVIQEQGVTFGIIVVKQYVLHSSSARTSMQSFGVQVFGSIPVILMAQDSHGVPTYWGRNDIVNFLSKVPTQCIPWKEYTIAA